MKKIIAVIFSILLIILCVTTIKNNMSYNIYGIRKFKQHRDEFQYIADKMYKYKDNYKGNEYITVGINYSGENINCYLNGVPVKMTDDEINKILEIKETFGDDWIDRIMIYDGRVSFCVSGNHYAIVYSLSDKEPKFMSIPDEKFKIKVKKIEKKWYYLESK